MISPPMSQHKLMENVLLECELYLGAALLFPAERVRSMAMQNLDGCYKKRTLEAAKFTWARGMEAALTGDWEEAAALSGRAAGKRDGYGWGVNHGEPWITHAAAQVVLAVRRISSEALAANATAVDEAQKALGEARETLRKAEARMAGHPWLRSSHDALERFSSILAAKEAHAIGRLGTELHSFIEQTRSWCTREIAQRTSRPRPPNDVLPWGTSGISVQCASTGECV